jgi:hypothetical protein
VAHKMPTTHVGCYRPAVLDGGSNPPISTKTCNGPPDGGTFVLCWAPLKNMVHSGRLLALSARPERQRPRLARRSVFTPPPAHVLRHRLAEDRFGSWPAPYR